jgi:hypothetical protein
MRQIRTIFIFLSLLVAGITHMKAQPIPIELMFGNRYGSVDLAFSKKFSPESRLGFFHQNTVQFFYKESDRNSFILQDLLLVETFKNLNVAGGIAYNNGGFNPTAGLQYVFAGKKIMLLCAPRINIKEDYSYDIMTILQFKPAINDRLKLYTRIKLLNVFNNDVNIRSYQWFRLGLDMKGYQFGLAFNLDEYGPHPKAEASFGLFARKEIF